MERREFLKLSFLGGTALVLPSGLVHAVEVLTPNNPLDYLNGDAIMYKLYTNKKYGFLSPLNVDKKHYGYSLVSGKHQKAVKETLMPRYDVFLKFLNEKNIDETLSKVRPHLFRDNDSYTIFDENGEYIMDDKTMTYSMKEYTSKTKITYDKKTKTFFISKKPTKWGIDHWGLNDFDYDTPFKILIEIDGEINHVYNLKFRKYADDYLI